MAVTTDSRAACFPWWNGEPVTAVPEDDVARTTDPAALGPFPHHDGYEPFYLAARTEALLVDQLLIHQSDLRHPHHHQQLLIR